VRKLAGAKGHFVGGYGPQHLLGARRSQVVDELHKVECVIACRVGEKGEQGVDKQSVGVVVRREQQMCTVSG